MVLEGITSRLVAAMRNVDRIIVLLCGNGLSLEHGIGVNVFSSLNKE